MSFPRFLVAASLLLGLLAVALVWIQPLVMSREVVAVEPLPLREPRTIDVRLFNDRRLKRLYLHSGECRTQDDAKVRGPFDVQSVIVRGNKIWLCPDLDVRRPDRERCVWQQATTLHCLEPPVLSAKGESPKRYGKELRLRIQNKHLRLINHVELERYIESVVMTEHAYAPFEARRVQAIVARTFAVHAVDEPRHDDAPICDTTHCQAFASSLSPKPDELAAVTTRSVVLVDSERELAPTFFHSTCGGHTHSAGDVWPGSAAKDIVGIADLDENGRAYCRKSRHFRWRKTLTAARLATALRGAAERRLDPKTLQLQRLDDRGLRWLIKDRRGRKKVRGSAIHRSLGRALGFSVVKSARFEIVRRGSRFLLNGRGLGHGVGLCQKGAEARAKRGQEAEDILSAYYPRLDLAHLDDLESERP